MTEPLDESILQRIRVVLARRRRDAAPAEIMLLGVSGDRLARHAEELFRRSEADGAIVRRRGVSIPLALGGLTPVGWQAMQDRSAVEAAARKGWRHRLTVLVEGAGQRLLDLGWKLAAGIALAAILPVIGLS